LPPTFIVATPRPNRDDPMLADGKLERLPTVERTVELLTLGAVFIEPTRIVHNGGLTGLRVAPVPILLSVICKPMVWLWFSGGLAVAGAGVPAAAAPANAVTKASAARALARGMRAFLFSLGLIASEGTLRYKSIAARNLNFMVGDQRVRLLRRSHIYMEESGIHSRLHL